MAHGKDRQRQTGEGNQCSETDHRLLGDAAVPDGSAKEAEEDGEGGGEASTLKSGARTMSRRMGRRTTMLRQTRLEVQAKSLSFHSP